MNSRSLLKQSPESFLFWIFMTLIPVFHFRTKIHLQEPSVVKKYVKVAGQVGGGVHESGNDGKIKRMEGSL